MSDIALSFIEARSEVVLPSGCMIWMGSTNGRYGKIGRRSGGGQKMIYAHRAAYEAANGPIPDGMNVCHRCDVPVCVNPDHLFVGSQADNVADMHRKGRRPKKYNTTARRVSA